jgi:hypothetical protein
MARVQVVLAVLAVPSLAAAQANQADLQARFDRALTVFNSPRQPEAIPQFSQLIDDLRALRNRSNSLTTLLARALQYRAQARENVGQTADADADLRLIREVAPNFRLTDPGLSAALVNRFNAMTSQPPASPGQPARAAGTAPERRPTFVSGGYEYASLSDCDGCNLSRGGYVDVASRLLPTMSLAGEISGATGPCCDGGILFFGAGARVHPPVIARAVPYGQFLIGGFRVFSESKTAIHMSGGIDYLIGEQWGIRGGLTYMRAFFDDGSFGVVRIAVGVTAIIR